MGRRQADASSQPSDFSGANRRGDGRLRPAAGSTSAIHLRGSFRATPTDSFSPSVDGIGVNPSRNGLEDLPSECEIVVIHDAARPLVSSETIGRVIDEARKGNGAVAALPVADTLKRADSSGRIIETVDRFGIWRAQTPQAFPRKVIERAHREAREADRVATDDAALCEQIGLPVVVVRGSERAVKITEEIDFALAEALSIFRE